MITTESMINKVGDWKYSVFVGETVRDKKHVWDFYYFNGEIDGECSIAFFNPENFNLEILFGGQHYTDVNLIQGFAEGWFLSKYDWSDFPKTSKPLEQMTDEETAKWILNSELSEEQLFDEILMEILCELEVAIGFEETAQYHLESARKEISSIVNKQTEEASK